MMDRRILFISIIVQCHWSINAWHQRLTFHRQLSYENNDEQFHLRTEMKFFMWYQSYAIYGAREQLILLQANPMNSSVNLFSYHWPIDSSTMDECLQEWNIKEKCYNDIVHVRLLPNSTQMDVYATYAHRPMIRSFDLQSMSFIREDLLRRDPHPPIDSERSYVMLNLNQSVITAGYQGDYIPTIRGTHGKTLLYALRQNAYFIGGFPYDGKAVFGIVEPSDRFETTRVSRLVMSCANRAEIVRKATLNCSMNSIDGSSRAFVFHILTALVNPIETENGTVLLFATFTTDNSTITASAVCMFVLNRQFYDVFTGPSLKSTRMINHEMQDLILHCSPNLPSMIDRDLVESERQFRPYLSDPLLVETMSDQRFSAINIIEIRREFYCLIIGTSDGRLITVFINVTLGEKIIYEELTLPFNNSEKIQSINYQKMTNENESYVIFVTHPIGYSIVQLIPCDNDRRFLCFTCWRKTCSIRQMSNSNEKRMSSTECPFVSMKNNRTRSLSSFSPVYIIVPLTMIIFVLSLIIVILLFKSQCFLRRQCFQLQNNDRKRNESSSAPVFSHSYTNTVLYRTRFRFDKKKTGQHVYPMKTDLCLRSLTRRDVYSSMSSQSLPSLVIPSNQIQPLSVDHFLRSYV